MVAAAGPARAQQASQHRLAIVHPGNPGPLDHQRQILARVFFG
jgi:hypothetical protein